MNMNRIIDMVVRTVIRRLVSTGVNAGFDAISKKRPQTKANQEFARDDGPWQRNPQSKQQRARAAKMAQRATRHMTKF